MDLRKTITGPASAPDGVAVGIGLGTTATTADAPPAEATANQGVG